MKGVQGFVISDFTTKDLIATQIECGQDKQQKALLVCPAYFSSDFMEMLPTAEFKEWADYHPEKKLELLVGNDLNAHHTV